MTKTLKYNTICQAIEKIGLNSFEDYDLFHKATTTLFTRTKVALAIDSLRKSNKTWAEISDLLQLGEDAAIKTHSRYLPGGTSEK